MRKLYLKIVGAIWGVMLISVLAAIVTLRSATDFQIPEEFGETPPWEYVFTGIAVEADRQTRGKDEAAFIDWFRNNILFSGPGPLALKVLNEDSRVLFEDGPDGRFPSLDNERMAMKTVALERDGRNYTIVIATDDFSPAASSAKMRGMVALLMFRPKYPGLPLLFAIPISVLLSFLIARYLVRPLRTFERAGARLSAGDLDVRVSPELGNRGDEIAEFASTFDDMAARIQDLVRSHKHLLRDVSHELRTPLARLLAATSLARRQTNGLAQAEFDRVELEVERLNTMIGRLLTYAQLDAGRTVKVLATMDFGALVSDIVDASLIEASSRDILIELAADGPCRVEGDKELLRSSIENVLRNAVRHAPESSIINVELSRSKAPGYCLLTVADRGPGVAEDELQHIFDPFYRTDPARQPQIGGSGIGLAIAQKSVELHQGQIAAKNALAGGLVVEILLPMAADAD
ncbi:MAG: HAMP domain-containing sensor histidine kinase [Woeseiaceae bacterium]|nr:HAMP domain-containing sensor histidine kinase [Woeseiaceae bacterium]